MKLPRDMAGRALVQVLVKRWNYHQVHQVGSHVILETEQPRHHRISIPDHQALRIGTLNAILRSVAESKGVSREDILQTF